MIQRIIAGLLRGTLNIIISAVYAMMEVIDRMLGVREAKPVDYEPELIGVPGVSAAFIEDEDEDETETAQTPQWPAPAATEDETGMDYSLPRPLVDKHGPEPEEDDEPN